MWTLVPEARQRAMNFRNVMKRRRSTNSVAVSELWTVYLLTEYRLPCAQWRHPTTSPHRSLFVGCRPLVASALRHLVEDRELDRIWLDPQTFCPFVHLIEVRRYLFGAHSKGFTRKAVFKRSHSAMSASRISARRAWRPESAK